MSQERIQVQVLPAKPQHQWGWCDRCDWYDFSLVTRVQLARLDTEPLWVIMEQLIEFRLRHCRVIAHQITMLPVRNMSDFSSVSGETLTQNHLAID